MKWSDFKTIINRIEAPDDAEVGTYIGDDSSEGVFVYDDNGDVVAQIETEAG